MKKRVQPLLVLSTAEKLAEAEQIAQVLVGERLAACVNLLPQIDSRYWWEGKIQSGQEVLMLIKTTSARLPALTRRIKALHSYTTPEVIALPIVGGSADYLNWLTSSTRPSKTKKRI